MLKPILKLLTLVCILSSFIAHRYIENNTRPEYEEVIRMECEELGEAAQHFPSIIKQQLKFIPNSANVYRVVLRKIDSINTDYSIEQTRLIHDQLYTNHKTIIEIAKWNTLEEKLEDDRFYCPQNYKLYFLKILYNLVLKETPLWNSDPELLIHAINSDHDTSITISFNTVEYLKSVQGYISIFVDDRKVQTSSLPIAVNRNYKTCRLEITNPITGETRKYHVKP